MITLRLTIVNTLYGQLAEAEMVVITLRLTIVNTKKDGSIREAWL